MSDLSLRSDVLVRMEEGEALDAVSFDLSMRPKLTLREFSSVCEYVGRLGSAQKWWAGDLFNEGERRFGEAVYQALEGLQMSPEGRMECARVAAAIPRRRRRATLSWGHHRAVAARWIDPGTREEFLDRAGSGGTSSDAGETVLSPDLASAAQVWQAQRDAVKDKSYRATPIGGEVARFLRSLRWSEASENTLLSYETTLSRLALDFAHKEIAEVTLEDLRGFLDVHWGEASAATRRQRLAAVKSFYRYEVDERGLALNPIEKVKPPKVKNTERRAYAPDLIDQLRDGQESLRDQIAMQLFGRLGLRRNELRLLKVRDFNLAAGTVLVHGKGGKIAEVPLGFARLKADLEVHLIGRGAEEFFRPGCFGSAGPFVERDDTPRGSRFIPRPPRRRFFPKREPSRPFSYSGMHYWFKLCLKKAGVDESILMHELRHSAADNLWRRTLTHAQKLLRHESPATTAGYLHPRLDDLAEALKSLE